jgi:hypothetical protein
MSIKPVCQTLPDGVAASLRSESGHSKRAQRVRPHLL